MFPALALNVPYINVGKISARALNLHYINVGTI